MRLTPKQAETVAELIRDNPGEAVNLSTTPGDSRDVFVTVGKDRFTVGGRGSVRTV